MLGTDFSDSLGERLLRRLDDSAVHAGDGAARPGPPGRQGAIQAPALASRRDFPLSTRDGFSLANP